MFRTVSPHRRKTTPAGERDEKTRDTCGDEIHEIVEARRGPAEVPWGFWHWHGVWMPRHAIEHPELISTTSIDTEENAEVRRAMIGLYGEARYIVDSGAELVHQDSRGRLWRREQRGFEPIVIVEVRNSTPEPDGSIKNYFLRVPPDMRMASEAVAWTFGLTVYTYQPRVET